MHTVEIFNKYHDVIQKLFRSRLLLQIMLSLGDEGKTLAELREITGSTSQAIIPKIRFLEKMYYIKLLRHDYILTPQGKIISSQIDDHIKTTFMFSKDPKFWSSHYLEAIPAPFLRDIGDLFNSEIVETNNTDIFFLLKCFIEMLENSEWIHIVSSFMSHSHADALISKVKEGVPLDMVVNTEVAEELRKEPFLSKINEIAGYDNFRVYVAPVPLLIGLTTTNSALSFGMCLNDSLKYDFSNDLFSTDSQALAWGERLFVYYKDLSDEFTFF